MLLEERGALPKRALEVPMWLFGGERGAQVRAAPSLGTGAGVPSLCQPSGPHSLGLPGTPILQQNAPGWEQYVKLLTSFELEDSCSLRKFLAWR